MRFLNFMTLMLAIEKYIEIFLYSKYYFVNYFLISFIMGFIYIYFKHIFLQLMASLKYFLMVVGTIGVSK